MPYSCLCSASNVECDLSNCKMEKITKTISWIYLNRRSKRLTSHIKDIESTMFLLVTLYICFVFSSEYAQDVFLNEKGDERGNKIFLLSASMYELCRWNRDSRLFFHVLFYFLVCLASLEKWNLNCALFLLRIRAIFVCLCISSFTGYENQKSQRATYV